MSGSKACVGAFYALMFNLIVKFPIAYVVCLCILCIEVDARCKVDAIMYKWKNHFFKMKGGYRDGLKHQKGRNKGSLHSKVAQSYMTPSLYLCFIVFEQSLISNKDIGMVSCQLFFHLYNYSRIKVSLWAI